MNCYRITTNTLRWRVEILRERGILWWKRYVWENACWQYFAGEDHPVSFNTREQAVDRLNELKKRDFARAHGWQPEVMPAIDHSAPAPKAVMPPIKEFWANPFGDGYGPIVGKINEIIQRFNDHEQKAGG